MARTRPARKERKTVADNGGADVAPFRCPVHGNMVPTVCSQCGVRRIAICSALDDTELHDLESIMTHRRIGKGQTLVLEGDKAGYAYNVITGALKLYKSLPDGRTQLTGVLLPGDFLGLPLRGTYPYSADAVSETSLCQFPAAPLRNVFDKYGKLQERVLAVVNDELSAAQEHMLLLGRKTALERVCSFLLTLVRRAEALNDATDPLYIPLSRHEIADYLGLTLETVSRTFSQLDKDGVIDLVKANQVVIADRTRLEEIASGAEAF